MIPVILIFAVSILVKFGSTSEIPTTLTDLLQFVHSQSQGCLTVTEGLLAEDEFVFQLANRKVTPKVKNVCDNDCICFMDSGYFIEFLSSRTGFGSFLDPMGIEPVAFAVRACEHSLFIVSRDTLAVTEYWLPRSVVPHKLATQKIDHGFLRGDIKCDLGSLIINSDMNFHGEQLTAAYDKWNPFVLGDTSKGTLNGGIFPDVFDVLAAMLNFTK